MARIRRTAVQTLEFKIEKAEERVSKTRAAHEKAIDDLKKLYDVRKGYQKDLIMKALETSARSLDEILSFINTTIEDAKGCEDWGGLTLWIYFRGFFSGSSQDIFSFFRMYQNQSIFICKPSAGVPHYSIFTISSRGLYFSCIGAGFASSAA